MKVDEEMKTDNMPEQKYWMGILLVGLLAAAVVMSACQESEGSLSPPQSRSYRVTSGQPAPAGRILSVEITDNMISLTWESFGAGSYRVQYTDDLSTGSWSDVAGTEWPITETQWTGDDLSGMTRIKFWTEGSTVKIRPFDSSGTAQSIHIKAAKNEYEAFQVAVSAAEGLNGVSALVSALTGPEGTISSENIRLYREAYMNVVTPSNIFDGEAGLWPDALIPATDVFFDETRDAFPFDVPAGENRAIWVDVFVPPTTNAGTYTGNLTITASGENLASVPLTLTVWDFALPSTCSLTSAFGFDGWENLRGHYGSYDEQYSDEIVPLAKLYAQSGLMHRISLEGATQEDWSILPAPPTAPIDWAEFDTNWGPFFDGIDLPYGLNAARLTSLSISTCGDTDQEKITFWQHFVSHFKEKGWFDRLFDYTYDEPSEAYEFNELKDRASLIKQADPDLRVLSTVDIKVGTEQKLIGVLDIWVPVINAMHDKPGEVCWYSEYAGNQRDQYDERLAAGDELWWYQSCMSHGCYTSDDECESGWPSYMIDVPAIYNRIMEWQTFKYNISGELYFATNYAYEHNDNASNDPWNTVYYFGGNGDGTLFYPGRPHKIGGTHHIPVASIRLKMIREGMEDYEYMKMLKDLGAEPFARSQVDSVVTNTYTFTHDPATLYTARENMAERILSTLRKRPLSLSQIKYWAYQIQDISRTGAVDELANSHYDMLVLEPTRTDWSSDDKNFDTKAMVEKLKNTKASDGTHRKLIVAYIDIGEAEDWRWYWTWSKEWPQGEPRPADWPNYILTHDPDDWEGDYPLAYWDERWKDIVIYGNNQDSSPYGDYNSVIDEVIKDGFDGIYLDWVEGFENDEVMAEAQKLGKDSAVEMIHFIQEMRGYAIERNPSFVIIQQNAAALCEDHPELFSVIDAISQEAIWYDGEAFDDWNATDGYDIPNDSSLVNYYIEYLDQYTATGIPVFNCEYALEHANDAYNKSYNKDYIPYCTRRSLSNLTTTPPPGY